MGRTEGGADFRILLGHVKFEVCVKHPNEDAEDAIELKSLEFRDSPGNISLGWRYNSGSQEHKDNIEVKKLGDNHISLSVERK